MQAKTDRIGEININHQGCKMEIVEYNLESNITVKFEDGFLKNTTYNLFKKGHVYNPNYKVFNERNNKIKNKRLQTKNINKQGYEMKIIEYIDANHIVIQFNDDYSTQLKTSWQHFKNGTVKNPNAPTINNIGIVGVGAPTSINGKKIKEFETWLSIIYRCYKNNIHNRSKTYYNCSISEEWKYYPNFYNWIINQSNYEKWKNNNKWHIDKDIIKKGNKIYCKEYCCLIPDYINSIFKNTNSRRGDCPIGVCKNPYGNYFAQCGNPFTKENEHLGTYKTKEEAFAIYKKYREETNQKLAEIEYNKGNIKKECRDGIINYKYEITD